MHVPGLRIAFCLSLFVGLLAVQGCSDDCEEGSELGSTELGLVRGRVRAEDGSELERVTVRVADQSARTDRDGLFELEVPAGEERRIRVDSEEFAGGEAVVRVERGDVTSLDLSVMQMRRLDIPDAERGGRFEGDDGFAIELPERALRTEDGEVARGEAELRYAAVLSPESMRVPPDLRARDADGNDVRLRSHGMVEVRFYQDDARLRFEGEARTELPLPEGSALRDGDRPGMYHYDTESLRWVQETEASVEDGKWVARLDRFSWWSAAEPIDALGCISASLRAPSGEPAEGTVVTAIGLGDLWLSTAVSDADGEVCVEAPLDTSLSLSAFFESGGERGEWSAEETTPGEPGTCGGDGCAELGEQDFEGGPIAAPGGEGGVSEGGATGGTGTDGGTQDDGGNGGTGGGFAGLMESGQTSVPGETVVFTFEAEGGERLAYRLTNMGDTTADSRVVDPAGGTVSGAGTAVSAGSTRFEDAFVLPGVAGEYRFEVTPRSEGEGSFVLDLFGVPDDASDDIAVDGSAVTLDIGSVAQNGRLVFQASGGERLAYVVSSTVNTTTDIRLEDPSGNGVGAASDTVSTGGEAFQDLFVLPQASGSYVLRLDPRQEGTGTLTLRLFSVPVEDGASVSAGGSATVNLGSVAQNGRLTFEAEGGERLAYTLDSTASTTTDVRLRDPLGDTVSGASDTVGGGSSAYRDTFTLPAVAGTYTFEVDPRGQGTGTVTLNLLAVPADEVVAIEVDGGPTSLGTTAIGQDGAYTFTASGSERLAYTVDSTASTTADLRVRDPNGQTVSGASDTVSAGGSAFRDVFTLPAVAGTYAIEVDPREQGFGGFSIDLFSVPADDALGPFTLSNYTGSAARSVTVSTPGQNAAVSYTASAGARVAYFVTNDGDTTVDVRLVAPSGGSVSNSSEATGAGATDFQGPFELPQESGTYVLEIDPRTQGTGNYSVQLYEVTPSTVTATATLDGGAVGLDMNSVPGQTGEVSFTPGAGTTFTFEVVGGGGTQTADLTLLDPGGVEVSTGAATVGSSATRTSDPITAVAGSYTLIVDPRLDGLNTFDVSIDSFP